jgi:predicted acetyltransferase
MGSSKLRYRFARKKDLPRLAELNFQLIRDEGADNPMTLPQLQKRMGKWLASRYRAVLFESGAESVGYALFREDEEGVYVRQFFICRGLRRRGFGRSAIKLLLREVLSKGRGVTVEVLIQNKSALSFWRAVGFEDHTRTLRIFT